MKQQQRFHLIGLVSLVVLFLVTGCGRQTPVEVETSSDFVEALREAGVNVQVESVEGPTILNLTPQEVNLGEERLLMYSTSEPLDVSEVRAAMSADLSGAYLWAGTYLLVYYEGKDGGTVLLVDSLLGDPVIGPQAAGIEPYPPAIPATIRIVADAFGADPAGVEVLDYEMVEWADSCLGMQEEEEDCALAITPGWRVELRVGTILVEAHTDELGENIRWSQP